MTIRKRRHLQKGEVLDGRYRIVEVLGTGGMGTVYKAQDMKLRGKLWAVKQTAMGDENPTGFMEEAETLMKLNHPFLPDLIDFIPPDREGHGYLVMDYIEGDTLQGLFEKNPKDLSYKRIIKYTGQLCEVLQYLHSVRPHPIIYRDLKPANVMIDAQDNIRLIDFGIARHFRAHLQADTIPLGTIGFAAPEQLAHKQSDERTDLYQLGAMMYYLLSGGKYYSLHRVPLGEMRPDLPNQLISLVEKLLRDDPDDRCQSAEEALARLLELTNTDKEALGYADAAAVSSAKQKLIVVGSAYPGAGSTFFILALASALNKLQIHHDVAEYPTIEPDLYSLLQGEYCMPENYRFLQEHLSQSSGMQMNSEWREGFTQWHPANPMSLVQQWDTELGFKFLTYLKNPIVIVDISNRWNDPAIIDICAHADDLVLVVDSQPVKLRRQSTMKIFDALKQFVKNGKAVHIAANRDPGQKAGNEWLRSLPLKPDAVLPNIPYEIMLRFIREGNLFFENSEIQEQLFHAIFPFLRVICPSELKSNGKKIKFKRGGWLLGNIR
jgi:serine/threonine protein kinase